MFDDNVVYRLVPLLDNKDRVDPRRKTIEAKCIGFGKGLALFETPIEYAKAYMLEKNITLEIPSQFEVFAYTNANILIRDRMEKFGITGYYKLQEIK